MKQDSFSLTMLVDTPVDIEIIESLKSLNENLKYTFRISTIDEYKNALSIIESYKLNAAIIPYFTGYNQDFFEEFVYLNKEEILGTRWTKQQIFAHQVINTTDFGKLNITPEGKIYANANFQPVGTVYEDIRMLVYAEMKNGESWRRTRNAMKPCNNCLYKYLCPSLSNYEIAIGKTNLCSVQ